MGKCPQRGTVSSFEDTLCPLDRSVERFERRPEGFEGAVPESKRTIV
jgi:hypothetical protein